ncbi:hypothetical protein SLS54_008865 [Diplodia seriata]
MNNIRDILNEDSSTSPSNGSCDSYIGPSSINDHSRTAAQSTKSRGLKRMSLDFVAPGSRSAPNGASQSPYHSIGYAHCGYSVEYNHPSPPIFSNHVPPQHSSAYASTSAQHSPWTSVNPASNYRQTSTTRSTNYSKSEFMDPSNPGPPSTYYQSSLSGSSKNSHADAPRREPRRAYGEEERAFIMVCATLRDGLWPTYPEQKRTASGLTCAYYRIRDQWGIPKVRGVSDEQKPEVKAVVKKTVLNMYDFPDL